MQGHLPFHPATSYDKEMTENLVLRAVNAMQHLNCLPSN